MRSTKNLIAVFFVLFLCIGCGGSGSSSSETQNTASDDAVIDETSYELKLSIPSLEPGALVSSGGQATIQAYVVKTDLYDDGTAITTPVNDDSVVNFYTVSTDGDSDWDEINTSGRIDPVKTTVNGYAEAVYQAENYGGDVKIYAEIDDAKFGLDDYWGSGKDLDNTISFEVATGEPAAIVIDSITPEVIGVAGSGVANTSFIIFKVNDNAGNPVPDYSNVVFNITTPLGGGETLSVDEADTQNGSVSVSVISGTVSGTVGVNATYYDVETGLPITTEAKVTIVSGLPAVEQLGMAVESFNIAGGRTYGLQDEITVYLGDRYGNIVPDGTKVSLMSEGGTIGTSDGFEASTEFGVASAILQTSPPTTPDLGGVQTSTQGNLGWCRVVAYTPGDEGFNDINGNNVYDEGIDVLTMDLSEPYIDANDNGQYDSGEKYIDIDGSAAFTDADGQYQANTMIWDSINVLFSAEMASINLTPSNFTLSETSGGSVGFSFSLGDIYGNALVGGTSVEVTFTAPDDSVVAGNTSFVVPDSLDLTQNYSFTLTVPSTTEKHTSPLSVTVTVTPPTDEDGNNAGNSGNTVEFTSYGAWN